MLLAKIAAAEEDEDDAEESQDDVMILPTAVERAAVALPVAQPPAPAAPAQTAKTPQPPTERTANTSAPSAPAPARPPRSLPVQAAASVTRAASAADGKARVTPPPATQPVKQAAVPQAKPIAASPQAKAPAALHPQPVATQAKPVAALQPQQVAAQTKPATALQSRPVDTASRPHAIATQLPAKPAAAAAAPQPKQAIPASPAAPLPVKATSSVATHAALPHWANPVQTPGVGAGALQKAGGDQPARKQVLVKAPAKTEPAPAAGRTTPQAKGNESVAEKADKPPEPKGVLISSLKGDLKMIITGDSSVRVLVTFRPYAKSRRERVTRSEAKEVQKVSPLVAKTRPETREAVIESAREGVYTFSVLSEKDGARAAFTLKIFESGSREKVAAIGTRSVSGKSVLAKVLMPEGILWDDEAAFTGSMEDSDSTTKFNAQSGVYWKEFND